MDNKEEQYLDNLLKSVMGQDAAEIMENAARQSEEKTDDTITEEESVVDFGVPEEPEPQMEPVTEEKPITEENQITEENPEVEEMPETEQPEVEETPVIEEPSMQSVEEGNMSDELKLDDLDDELKIDDIEGLGDELSLDDLNLEEFGDDIKLDDIEVPAAEESPVAVEETAAEESPVAVEETAAEESPVAVEETAAEESPVVVEEAAEESPAAVEETPTEGNQTPVEETPVLEEPVIDEAEPIDVLENATAEDDLKQDELDLDNLMPADNEEDSDLSEINDLLKKSENNEPIAEEDDMMKLLEQIADDEEAFVDAEDKSKEEQKEQEKEQAVAQEEDKTSDTKKAKKKKEKKPKKQEAEETEKEPKKKGAFGKFFDVLTEDLVPEPTEEELAKEAAEKKAKKEEEKTKKEEAKAAKEEEKKAKDEEKAAAKAAKAEAAAAKKKEKAEAKAAKAAAKKAKEEENPTKQKRISPKKLLLVAVFAASVFAIVMVFSNMISTQGMLQRARKAYYAGDYATAYQELYGEKLDESDTLVQERSRIILTMQRKYDSYVNHLKMNDELKALDSLITGVQTYYLINSEAEEYGCLDEIKSIKTQIVNILTSNYGITEQDALDLLLYEDEISYTKSLNDIIMSNNSGTTGYASGSD